MKYWRLHENPDSVLVTPQFLKHYKEKIEAECPGMEIIADSFVPMGNSYLVSKKDLIKQFEEIKQKESNANQD